MDEGPLLQRPVERLPGVGPKRAQALRREGIETASDLLFHLPARHRRLPPVRRIADLRPGERAVVRGRVASARSRRRGRRGWALLEIDDGSGRLRVFLFGRPYLARRLAGAADAAFSGRAVERDGAIVLAADEVLDPAEVVAEGGYVPVYRLPPEVPPRLHRRLLALLLDEARAIEDWRRRAALPPVEGLAELGEALRAAHRPRSAEDWERARRRFAYEEFVRLLLGLAERRSAGGARCVPLELPEDAAERALRRWPFSPTASQRRALLEIVSDLRAERPMHRLLQGDVGTGKTAVFLEAARLVCEAGRQAALLAPTELLALQHVRSAREWFAETGPEVVAFVGSLSGSERRRALEVLSSDRPMLAVGTHALLADRVLLPRLALALVDEQQRFGVAQRARLRDKREGVHFLVATATPIPRTLALTLYGDLDVSRLTDRPPGRLPVTTRVEIGAEGARRAVRALEEALAAGGAAFVICPFVDPPEGREWLGAVWVCERLRRRFGAGRVALAHGRLPPAENERALDDLRAGRVAVLVSTVVVEVGVDVPHATDIVVLGAERFGLAALHQLRGRVGRGGSRGRCVLVASRGDEAARARLRVLEETSDGLAVAERDLALRGGGRVFGREQSGAWDGLFADPLGDVELLLRARRDVSRMRRAGPSGARRAGAFFHALGEGPPGPG